MSINLDANEANYVYCSIICQLLTDGKANIRQLSPGLQEYLMGIKESLGDEEPEEGTAEYNLKYYANHYFPTNEEDLQ